MKTRWNFVYSVVMVALLSACGGGSDSAAPPSPPPEPDNGVNKVLIKLRECSPSITLRSQALTVEQENAACALLGESETKFHQVFNSRGKPVKDDNNTNLRANIYMSQAEYEKYAGQHFNMPTDNGGMYLEGIPGNPNNHAEFVTNQRLDGSIRNLAHEYIHYLDGRFNLYGDFCANLQDSHEPPENCAKPSPPRPYLIWWSEGLAEYLSKGNVNAKALEAAKTKAFALSQLFDTGYETLSGTERVYYWGYLAVRFMMERHREQIEAMLTFTRTGDFPRYQALVKSWGTTYDTEFEAWMLDLEK